MKTMRRYIVTVEVIADEDFRAALRDAVYDVAHRLPVNRLTVTVDDVGGWWPEGTPGRITS